MVHKLGTGRYVLKFISGKYQGGEFALEMNQELIIGRSSELEMVLIEDMVSRHHAKITTTETEIFIEDLGSTNGTFVNGEKITSVKLKNGDRILIGTSIVKLVYEELDASRPPPPPMGGMVPPDEGFRSAPSLASAGQRRVIQQAHTNHGTQSGVMSGVIDQVPLPDLMQLFASNKKTGCLFVTTPAGTEGRIYLRDGRVYGSVINENFDIAPDKCFYRMMAWTTGTFLLDNLSSHEFAEPMDASVESLLMESMRILDETNAIGADVPAFEDVFKIAHPLTAPLRAMSPEQLDIFQLALNEPSMESILNNSKLDDLETTKHVVYLLQNNYLVPN